MALPYSASDVANYGLPAGGFVNYLVDVTDPTTDQDAAAYNLMAADCAQMTRTAIKAWAVFTTAATTGALALVKHGAMWGNVTPPTLARSSAGVFTVTWPATVTDPLGASTFSAIAWASASVHGATFAQVQAAQTSINVATVYTFSGGAAADIVGTNVLVMAG